jgi:hypothetical protein
MSATEYDFTNLENLHVFIEDRVSNGTWSVFEALGLRLTFVYENGLILTVCGDGKISAFNSPNTTALGAGWSTTDINGVFQYSDEAEMSDIETIILDLMDRNGVPALKLPWEEFYESALEELEDADEEDLEVGDLALREAQKIIEGEITDPMWSSAEITFGDNYLPKDCDFNRFEEMVNQLESENWIVIWNECCGTCAGGSIRSQREVPEYASAPAFVVYGQNADAYFAPDGSVHDYLHYPDEFGKGYEMELAKKYGFKVTDQGDGFFIFN